MLVCGWRGLLEICVMGFLFLRSCLCSGGNGILRVKCTDSVDVGVVYYGVLMLSFVGV